MVLHFECKVQPLYGNSEIEAFVKKTVIEKRGISADEYYFLQEDVKEIIYPQTIYVVDLNKDNIPEYIVPYQCGAVGNCSYVIFADHPPRILGEIGAEYIIFTPVKDKWPDIMVYGHMGAADGAVGGYIFTEGKYVNNPDINFSVIDGVDKRGKVVHTWTDFFKKIGPVKCECEKGK